MKTISDVLPSPVLESWHFTPIKKGKKAPVGFYGSWLNHPLTFDQALRIYVDGHISYTGIDSKTKKPIPGLTAQVGAIGVLCGSISDGLLLLDHDGSSCDSLLAEWGEIPVTAKFSSGKEGHYQLAFKVPEKFWDSIETYKEKTGTKDANGKPEQIELRWTGCQSLVHGVHPETGNYYQWDAHSEIAEAPLFLIEKMLRLEEESKPDPPPKKRLSTYKKTDWTDRDWAFSYLDAIRANDLGWYEWRDCILAAHESGLSESEARQWSSSSAKHTDRGFDDVWRHIKGDSKPVGLGTLGSQAKKDGWVSPFPKRDRPIDGLLSAPKNDSSQPNPDQADPPDYDLTLDEIDKLETAEQDTSKLHWLVTNYAYDSGLKQRGFSADYLLSQAQARRDNDGVLEVLSTRQILEMHPQRNWIVGGLIPSRSVTILAAQGGIGKTSLVYDVEKAIAFGYDWCEMPVTKGRVINVQVDEPLSDTADKLREGMFYDVPDEAIYWIGKWRFTQIRQLFQKIEEIKPSLVVIDSITAAHAGTGVDMIASTAGDCIYKLRDYANQCEWDISFWLIHHMNKGGGMRDSSTFKDNASEIQLLYKADDDSLDQNEYVFEFEKSRAGLTGKYVMRKDVSNYRWIYLGLKDAPADFYAILGHLKRHSGSKFSHKRLSEEVNISFEAAKASLELARKLCLVESEILIHESSDGSRSRFRLYWARQINLHPEIAEVLPRYEETEEIEWQ